MMKKVRFYCEHKLLMLVGHIICCFPRSVVLWLACRCGDLIYYCIPIRKTMTIEHLQRAFPEKSVREIRRIARHVYQNLGMLSFEHLCLSSMEKEDLLSVVRFCDEDVLKRAYARGKGVIFVGGHLGNWEYMGGALSAKGYPMSYVVAEIGNPYINETVNANRRKMGVTIVSKGMSVRAIIKTLRANGGMAMLFDQDAGRNGIFVDFFGRPCSTPPGPARFALKTGAAVLFVSALRGADGYITAKFDEVDIDYDKGDCEENVLDITQRCSQMLESYVREYPGQWFWMHRRWKTQPEISSVHKDHQ